MSSAHADSLWYSDVQMAINNCSPVTFTATDLSNQLTAKEIFVFLSFSKDFDLCTTNEQRFPKKPFKKPQ